METKNYKFEKFIFNNGAGVPKTDYYKISYKEQEVGFISPEGIFLRMYHSACPEGVFRPVKAPEGMTDPNDLCKFMHKHLKAIHDSYMTTYRGK